nr:MAG TPA: hypothetical protein [Caudoviricetes sp.]
MFLKVKARLNNYHMRIVSHSRSLVGYPKTLKPLFVWQRYNNISK